MRVLDIKITIEQLLEKGFRKIVLYPFGDVGIQVNNVLEQCYGIKPSYIFDNGLCRYNCSIHSTTELELLRACAGYGLIICTDNFELYKELYSTIKNFFPDESIFTLPTIIEYKNLKKNQQTLLGKHSYGAFVRQHNNVSRIGNFCSFADGVEVVANHPLKYISTHHFLYMDKWDNGNGSEDSFTIQGDKRNNPDDKITVIGNDVWVGRNTIIIGGVNIGDGAICGAGSVITKNVPDYAVVAGTPARIINYRCDRKQAEAMKKIAWWDWDDDVIKDRFSDFYLSFDAFIEKYGE